MPHRYNTEKSHFSHLNPCILLEAKAPALGVPFEKKKWLCHEKNMTWWVHVSGSQSLTAGTCVSAELAGQPACTLLLPQLTYRDTCAHSCEGSVDVSSFRAFWSPSAEGNTTSILLAVSPSSWECCHLLVCTSTNPPSADSACHSVAPQWKPVLLWVPRWTGPEFLCRPHS